MAKTTTKPPKKVDLTTVLEKMEQSIEVIREANVVMKSKVVDTNFRIMQLKLTFEKIEAMVLENRDNIILIKKALKIK